jgi:hypothetical protein
VLVWPAGVMTNALDKLTALNTAQMVTDKPRSYPDRPSPHPPRTQPATPAPARRSA